MITALLLASAAHATPTTSQTFRVGHKLDLEVAGYGEDYLTDPHGRHLARDALVAICSMPCPDPTTQSTLVTDEDGLVTFDGLGGGLFKLVIFGKHIHDGVHLTVSESDELAWATSETLQPTTDGSTIDVTFDAIDPGNEWVNVAAVASFAIRRHPGAFRRHSYNGASYDFVMETPNVGKGGEWQPQTDLIVINPATRGGYADKFVVVHELGHAMQFWANVPPGTPLGLEYAYHADIDYNGSAPVDTPCFEPDAPHNFLSMEFQSAAISEGLANYVAAATFNRLDEADCRLKRVGMSLAYNAEIGSPDAFSCEGHDRDLGGVESYSLDSNGVCTDPHGYCVDDDFMGDYCGTTPNRATEFDWMKFFWDADTDGGLTMAKLFTLWDEADPHDWEAGPNLNLSDDDYPMKRLEAAFQAHAATAPAWDDHAERNGVTR
ncbi:MAG: hypothetical protein KTR31_41425 [Myxococcales bacterium]|nr:hypothetical protein [Myxococcales bacterium]